MDDGVKTANTHPDQMILEYCPSILNMANIQRLSVVRFERNTSFQKGTGRNRMLIAGSMGPILLSIPILGGRSHHQLYGETRIDHRLPWKRQHLGALKSNYGKSPYWEHYADQIVGLYAQEINLLFDWNMQLFTFFARLLCPDTTIRDQSASNEPVCQAHLIDLTQDIQLPSYHQVFAQRTGFLHNLSVMDLLLNVGHPHGRLYLENLIKPFK
ncbi:MAG: hypothetical protein EBS53_02585 [Bacteroidetes bacterium]|nr:hypothetical protein [Bacteroidota bacterium]